MWEFDSKEIWVPKNWCFWTVVLEKTLESPLDAKRSNQSILKEINPKHSLEGLMLKLKLQYFGHLMWRTDSLEKTLVMGKIEGRRKRDDRGWDGWMASPTQWAWVWANSGRWWRTGKPGVLQSMGSLRVRHDWVTSLSLFTFMHWRRKWQPTPVFLPGESQGWGNLVGFHLWGHTESDTTEAT